MNRTRIFYSALFDSDAWHLFDAGQIEEEELLHVSLLHTPGCLHDALKLPFDQWPRWMTPIPGADSLAVMAREAGLRLCLLSNTDTRFPRCLRSRTGSANDKVSKPDRQIYERLCERYSLMPRECLFADDLIDSINGAINALIEARLFDGDYEKAEAGLCDLGVIQHE